MDKKLYSIEELQALGVLREKADLTAPHGDGGLFATPGVRPTMYSTVVRSGNFADRIPLVPSRNVNERVEILTGVTASVGSNPDDACGVPAQPGQLTTMQYVVTYGEYYKGTRRFNITKASDRLDYSDTGRNVINFGSRNLAQSQFMPSPVTQANANINTPVGKLLTELGVSISQDFSYVHFQGDPSKLPAATRSGFIKEYAGLDLLIKTGHVDAVSGGAVPAADSRVTVVGGGIDTDLVRSISDGYRTVLTDAELVGMPNTEWAIVIHPQMKFALIDAWACNYHAARCAPNGTNGIMTNSEVITGLREEMNRGSYILVDGERVEIITDSGVALTDDGNDGLTSDIYLVPMRASTGPLTYLEYMPYNTQEVAEFTSLGFDQVRVINGGLYMMTYTRDGFCLSYNVHARTRLMLDARFLAARWDDVSWTTTTPFRDSDPASNYYLGGGVSTR